MKSMQDISRKRYKTIEVCELFDVSRATLFRWEREGLISGPSRDWRNWRLYTPRHIKEIKQIIRTRKSGQ
jgi:DNA-binding transcriptional MerR regulator